ncbi:MAG: mechanosensitive ion channel [Actinobacteria bacterium]|nr:mechanosensitive ion channel [Actinomycetota bacterium]
MSDFIERIVESTPLQLVTLIISAFFLDLVIRRIVRRAVKRAVSRAEARREEIEPVGASTQQLSVLRVSERTKQRAQAIGSLFTAITSLIIWIATLVLALQILGFDLLPLIASAGFIGAAVSFGAQHSIRDVLSGVSIILEDEFGIGDYVDLGPAVGTVLEVGLRTTRLRDAAGVIWHVRNGEITRVANRSQGWMLATVDLPITIDTDLARVRDVVEAVGAKLATDTRLSNWLLGRVIYAGVESVSSDAIVVRISVRTVPDGTTNVARALREELTKALLQSGILLSHGAISDSNPSPA